MGSFIENYQYNFIVNEATKIAKASHTVNDSQVKEAFNASALEKVLNLFPDLTIEQKQLLHEIITIDSEIELEKYKEKISSFCIPFSPLTDAAIKKLFRKVKKLNYPSIEPEEISRLTYFGWNDAGSNRKFIVRRVNGKLQGIHGRFTPSSKKGICHFCHQLKEVGLYTVDLKKKGDTDYYRALGNYVCIDNSDCNQSIMDVNKLDAFIEEVTKK
ncbi:MAG: FusB/FusC family EF-G-binding protein [Bacillus sp. (in: firmicutes)]